MKSKRIIQFALAGLLIALLLQAVGYRLDHAAARIPLASQALYNWLTLLFSPLAFFLRLGNPDAPLAAGWATFLVILFTNASLYGTLCKLCQLFFLRLRQKLKHESPLVPAETPVHFQAAINAARSQLPADLSRNRRRGSHSQGWLVHAAHGGDAERDAACAR
jgi:hypothetical protein